jgi:hypothetical protein
VAAGYVHSVALTCSATPSVHTSPDLVPYSFANPRAFTAAGIQPTSTGATLTVFARGNLGTSTKFLTIKIDGVALSTNIFGAGSGASNCSATASTATFAIPAAQFTSLTADGALEIRIEPSINATSSGCTKATLTVQLNYTRDIVDCNSNGIDDECEIAIQPAAPIIQLRRIVPMEQGAKGADARFEQGVDQAVAHALAGEGAVAATPTD